MNRLTATALVLCLTGVPALSQTDTTQAPAAPAGASAGQGEPAIDTKLPLDAGERENSTQVLQGILYDLASLQSNVHQAHWNIEGIEYIQLHEFYQDLYETLFKFIDEAAERKLQLGVPADNRPEGIVKSARIKSIETGFIGDEESLRILVNDYSTMSAELYDGIEATDGDLVTQDLLIAFAHMVDQHYWQLRAHLRQDMEKNGDDDGTATK